MHSFAIPHPVALLKAIARPTSTAILSVRLNPTIVFVSSLTQCSSVALDLVVRCTLEIVHQWDTCHPMYLRTSSSRTFIESLQGCLAHAINLVRDRCATCRFGDHFDLCSLCHYAGTTWITLRKELEYLRATHVITCDELQDRKTIKAKVKEWTNGQVFAPLYRFRSRSTTCAHRISVSV
jgi:hypothetical protein